MLAFRPTVVSFCRVVYFVQSVSGGPIKIGTAKHVPKRLEELQIGHPEKLIVLGVLEGGSQVEMRIHRFFARLWLRGEWFQCTPDLLAFIEEHVRAERHGRYVPHLDAMLVLHPREARCKF